MPTYRTIAAVSITLAALTAGCSGSPAEEPTAAPSTTAAAAPAVEHTESAEPSEPAQPVEGTWRAGPAPLAKVVAALDKAGLGEYAETVILGNDPSSQVISDLKVQDGYVLVTWSVDDYSLGIQDRQEYTASASAVELRPIGSSCREALSWTVTDDRLRFELVEDTCPDYQDAPDAAMMTGLYVALPFQRVAP